MPDTTYTGAPDECSIHWPEKLGKNGDCQSCLEYKPVMLEPRFRAMQEREL